MKKNDETVVLEKAMQTKYELEALENKPEKRQFSSIEGRTIIDIIPYFVFMGAIGLLVAYQFFGAF